MSEQASPKRGTSTSQFGAGRRESHDASDFYARFTPPELSDDETVNAAPAHLIESGGACLHGSSADMHQLADNSVALVVTSPPYFVGKEYELAVAGDSATADDRIPESYFEFLDMLREVFAECVRVLEPGGRIAVNVANLGRKPYRSLSADVITILQDDLGLLLRGEVIWQKGKTASGSCAWGSFAKATNPVFRDVTERVIIASKGRFSRAVLPARRKQQGLPHESTLSNDEFVDVTRDIWEMDAESATRVGHPAPFPIELPRRLIDLYTYVGDTVVDPFMGSGTTLVAAARSGRLGVGFDTDLAYVELSQTRVAEERARVQRLSAVAEADEASEPDLVAELAHDERQDLFLQRAADEHKKVQDIARLRLEGAGFTVEEKLGRRRVASADLTFDFLASAASGESEWFIDVAGAFVSSRPGLQRIDMVWKTLGRLLVLTSVRPEAQLLVVTATLPRPGSQGDKSLRSVGAGTLFDAIELYDPAGLERLEAYGSGASAIPLAGFWSDTELADAGF